MTAPTPPLTSHVRAKLPHPSPSPLTTMGTPRSRARATSGAMRARRAGCEERMDWVRQWTVRFWMPVERMRRTSGMVGSAGGSAGAGSSEEEAVGVSGAGAGVVAEGSASAVGAVGAGGASLAAGAGGAAAEVEGSGSGRRRILASMGRSVALTSASRICRRRHEGASAMWGRFQEGERARTEQSLSGSLRSAAPMPPCRLKLFGQPQLRPTPATSFSMTRRASTAN